MNFSEQLITVIDELAKRLGIFIDWSQENVAPYMIDICHRYVKLHIVKECISIAICGLIFFSILQLCKLFIRSYEITKTKKVNTIFWDIEYGNESVSILGWILLTVLFAIGLIDISVIISDIYTLADLIFLPEIQIIEYLKQLM